VDIPFHGRYDQATVNQAVALATRPPRWSTWLRWGLFLGYLPIFVYLAFVDASADPARLTRPLFLLLVLASFAVFPYLKTFRLARGLWRLRSMQADRAGAVTGPGLVYRAHDGDRLLEWSQFVRRRQDADLVVLTTATGAITILPRRFFAGDDAWRRAVETLEQKVPTA
jgi:hypothetical protein